jgi:hypothetical protein
VVALLLEPPHAASPSSASKTIPIVLTRCMRRCKTTGRLARTVALDTSMKVVRPPVLAGCAVVLLVLCGVAGASATKRPDPGARVPYTSLELVLERGQVRATPLGAPAAGGGITGATAALAAVLAGATTPAAPAAGAAAKHALSFPQALAKLAANNEITAATASADVGAWNAARESEKQLSGTREFELGAVIGTLRRSRAPAS